MSELISPVQWQQTAAERAARARAEFVDSGIPVRFSARIDLPPIVQTWLDGPHGEGQSLYLAGGIGTGKTHAAFEIVRRLREADVVFHPHGNSENGWIHEQGGHQAPAHAEHTEAWRATTLLDALRPGADNARRTVDTCQRAGLLLLDDLGAEKPSDWTQERLYELIDERYIQQRPVIVTSNVPPRALAEWVGERTASRLAEMCTVIPLTGADRRRS
ncbi:MAG: hypothetical protein JWM02_3667 [Frankiales bacterium]|nr:hypothetical protein [Frankiales bacterium]